MKPTIVKPSTSSLFVAIAGWLPLGFLLLIAIALFWIYRTSFSGELSMEHDRWGQFGDYMGGVLNPFVGLMTIYLLVRTNRMQSRQLDLQREQLEAQIDELQAQKKSFATRARR